MRGILSALAAVLPWAAAAEFLLLRTFLRLGPVLPAHEQILPVYQVVEVAGLAAMNLAMLAAGVALGLAGVLLVQRRGAGILLGSLLLFAVFVHLALGPLLVTLPSGIAVMLQAATLLGALPALYAARARQPRGRVALGLILAAEVLALVPLMASGPAQLGLPVPQAGRVIFFAEAAALLAALALPWSFRPRWQRRDLAAGGSLAVVLLAAHTLRPSMLVATTMWNFAFSLFLPGIVYALALGCFVATLLALRREGQTGRDSATGLLLIALAGLRLDFTYFGLLMLVGFLICCRPWDEARHAARSAESPRRADLIVGDGALRKSS